MDAVLIKIIALYGSQYKLAAALGISQAAVSQWKRVPVYRCLALSQLTGIPLHELRPDVYPMPMPSKKRAAAGGERVSV